MFKNKRIIGPIFKSPGLKMPSLPKVPVNGVVKASGGRKLPSLPGQSAKDSTKARFYKALKERRQPVTKDKKIPQPSVSLGQKLMARDKKIHKMVTGK